MLYNHCCILKSATCCETDSNSSLEQLLDTVIKKSNHRDAVRALKSYRSVPEIEMQSFTKGGNLVGRYQTAVIGQTTRHQHNLCGLAPCTIRERQT